jgi:hypothetical protein
MRNQKGATAAAEFEGAGSFACLRRADKDADGGALRVDSAQAFLCERSRWRWGTRVRRCRRRCVTRCRLVTRRGQPASCPVMDKFGTIIDAWLALDRQRPAKQRHTAQRIWEPAVRGLAGSSSNQGGPHSLAQTGPRSRANLHRGGRFHHGDVTGKRISQAEKTSAYVPPFVPLTGTNDKPLPQACGKTRLAEGAVRATEREGFEPSKGLLLYAISSRVPSATRTPLQESASASH